MDPHSWLFLTVTVWTVDWAVQVAADLFADRGCNRRPHVLVIVALRLLTVHQRLNLSLVAIVVLLVWITGRSVCLQSGVELDLREIRAVRRALRNALNLKIRVFGLKAASSWLLVQVTVDCVLVVLLVRTHKFELGVCVLRADLALCMRHTFSELVHYFRLRLRTDLSIICS